MTMHVVHMPSPTGQLTLAADDESLHVVQFNPCRHPVEIGADWVAAENKVLVMARTQLEEYFAGSRHRFQLPFAVRGTAFQEQVWQALTEIPWGQTWSYRDIAEHIGKPTATRAVGAANGRNPLSIVRPCHRVIGADGSLTGFGGGLDTKRWLLQHEGALPQDQLFGT